VTTYYDIVSNQRIISSEVVETQGKKLLITMSTTTFEPEGAGTRVTVTAQLTSLAVEDMLNRAKFGHNASLNNLVEAMR
jgi:activator of Hsp90 ATPase-like protein